MRRLFAGLVVVCTLLTTAGPAYASHRERDRCRYEECGDRYGDGDNSNGNTGYDGEGGKSGDTDQRGDHNCRNFCFYGIPAPGGGDQQPKQLFPPNPSKFPMVIQSIIKSGLDLGQLFANGTIKFVEDLFTGLASVPVYRYI